MFDTSKTVHGIKPGRRPPPAWTTVWVLAGALVPLSTALAQSPTCGIDCGARTYTSCIDSANLMGGVTSLNCSASAGSCQGETFCATLGHQLPASAFPVRIEQIFVVSAGATPSSAAMPFDLLVYEESGIAAPGSQLGSTYSLSLPGSQSAAVRIDLSSGGLAPIIVPGPGEFRVCLRKQFDAGHNVCLDANGTSAPGRNWTFVRVALDPFNPCGPAVLPEAWYAADGTGSPLPGFPGLTGDFIIRALVRPTNITSVPGWSDCTGRDAGIGDASSSDAGVDTGSEADLDGGPEDAGPAVDSGEPRDAAPADSGASDGGSQARNPAPTISGVAPRQISSNTTAELVITGTGFKSGLSAQLGQISLLSPSVAGTTTVRATVPQGVADGLYDLVVENPDGQAVIAADAVRVGALENDVTGAVAAKDGCRCIHPPPPDRELGTSLFLLLAGASGGFVRHRWRRDRIKP